MTVMIRVIAAVLSMLALAAGAAAAPLRFGQVPPPDVGGPIELIDDRGRPFSLARHGRPALLFFGFTRCASTCPPALGMAQQLAAELGPRMPTVLFVTLDPLNDDPAQLRSLVGRLHGPFIGLTGTPPAVERVIDRYGVAVRGNAAGSVDHSSVWYLLDAHGRTVRVYPFSTPLTQLRDDLMRFTQPAPASP